MPKYFVDLYQASLEQNSKQLESHSNALKEANVKANAETNNAMVMDNSNLSIKIKDLDVSDFFEDPSGDIGHLIDDGVIGPNN